MLICLSASDVHLNCRKIEGFENQSQGVKRISVNLCFVVLSYSVLRTNVYSKTRRKQPE
jgi:hypothetical protein